jgi:hypothetical protein
MNGLLASRVLRFTFPMVAGAILLGYISAVSDNVYSPDRLSGIRWLSYALAGIVNDFAVWLTLASVVAWRCGRRLWQSVAYSVLFSVGAIVSYLVWSPILKPGNYMVDSWSAYLVWGSLAIIGGIVGGSSGYFARRWPIALLPIFMLALYRVIAEPRAWSSPLGATHHIALILLAAAIAVYWISCTARYVFSVRKMRMSARPSGL